MTIDWSPLRSSLRDADRAGVLPMVWWRDDDATGPTAALDRLLDLADTLQVPVHLAIVPLLAEPALRAALQDRLVVPVVHGWGHRNHAPEGQKKAEFMRADPAALHEAETGLRRLSDLLGTVAPMFVPPWNRVSDFVVDGLAARGYRALSTYTPRRSERRAGLMVVNTHLDPIAWQAGRGLADPDDLIARAADLIGQRIRGSADALEPFGLLTHHLVQDAATWDFSRAFLEEMRQSGCIVWSYEERT